MKTGILFAALLSLSGTSVFASSWHNFYSANTDEAEYFFDAESVVKAAGVVTVWVKTVQKDRPDSSDGSWSTAYNWRINCPKRTIQRLSSSSYEATGKFIKANSTLATENSVIPDSVGEGVLKAVCMADFPRSTPATKDIYFAVGGNDIFAFTRLLVEFRKSQVDNAPK